MYSDFKNNRRKVQKYFFETKFWELLEDDTIILEEKDNNAALRKVEITNIPVHQDLEMAFLINLELDVPIVANPPKAKTVEKALLLISEGNCSVYLFEMKSSLQAENDDISAICKKFSDSIARISVMLTTFVFDENFKENQLFYKAVVFYNRDNNLILDANPQLKREPIYKIFEKGKGEMAVTTGLGKIEQVEVYFCKNPVPTNPNVMTIDFHDFIEEYDYDVFKIYSTVGLPQIKG